MKKDDDWLNRDAEQAGRKENDDGRSNADRHNDFTFIVHNTCLKQFDTILYFQVGETKRYTSVW